jgi:transposase
MAKARTLVGLDVHAAKVVAAIVDAETGELRFRRLGGETEPVVGLCGSLEGPVRASYEAGPTGYGLARALDLAGVECVVAAPGKIPRGRGRRSRPTAATPSTWCGCFWRASCMRSGCRDRRRRRCAIWCAHERTSAAI